MKNVFRIGLALCMASLSSFAQTTNPAGPVYRFSVADCVNYAYQHQDSVKNAQLDVKSAEYKVKETTGIGLPQISGSASLLDYIKIPVTLIPGEFLGGAPGSFVPLKFGVKYQSNLSIGGNQIIFQGSYLVGLKASKTYKELSQRAVNRSRIEANVQVTKAYYQVLSSVERIKLIDSNLVQIKQILDQTIAENKQGVAEKVDVDRQQVQYTDLMTTRDNAVDELVLAYQMLKFQMGMPVDAILELTDRLSDVGLDPNLAPVVADSTLYRNRIEYQLAETQLKLNQLNVQQYKSQFLPSLSAVANYTSSYQNNGFGELYSSQFPSSYIGLQLNVPIFSGFQRKYQVKEAQITVQKSQNDMDNLRNALSLQANAARIGYTTGIRSLNSQKKIRDVAQEVLRVARIKYQQGVGSSIEVIQAEESLIQANDKYIQGLYDTLISKVDLDRAYNRIQ